MLDKFFKIVCLSAVLMGAQPMCTPLIADDWEEEFEDDYEEDYVKTLRTMAEGILDLVDENREVSIKPEDFIFPFSDNKKPMLSTNLIPSIEGVAGSFTARKKIKKAKPIMRRLGSKGVGTGGFSGGGKLPGFAANQTVGSAGALVGGKAPTAKKDKPKVTLPEFEISGKFGSKDESFVVIGNRFYTYGDRLKGSRDLRKVSLVAIDEQFAYFKYKKATFSKRIKATEPVFPGL